MSVDSDVTEQQQMDIFTGGRVVDFCFGRSDHLKR